MCAVLRDNRRQGVVMKVGLVSLVILLQAAIPAVAQQGKLVLVPAKADKGLTLVAKTTELVDGDAVTLYDRAVKVLPGDIPGEKIRQWRGVPASQLPLAEAEAVLKKYTPAFDLLEKAICCKDCKWPAFKPGGAMTANLANLQQYRSLAFGLALRGRVAIAKKQYGEAVDIIRAGLRMAQQLGESDVLVQQLVAVAIGNVMCQEIEQLMQSPGSPNLYWALQTLPVPLVDMEKSITAEVSNIKKNYNVLLAKTMLNQVKAAHAKVRMQQSKLNRHIAALGCIEGLRIYAAEAGNLPGSLADVTQVSVPDDPIEKKAFVYHQTGSSAVLEAAAPNGGKQKDGMHYELMLAK